MKNTIFTALVVLGIGVSANDALAHRYGDSLGCSIKVMPDDNIVVVSELFIGNQRGFRACSHLYEIISERIDTIKYKNRTMGRAMREASRRCRDFGLEEVNQRELQKVARGYCPQQ